MSLAAGFIGLGHLGGAIAQRLLDVGVALHVHDIDPARCAALAARGATAHASPRALADAAAVVFACLPNEDVSLRVALDEQGLVRGAALTHYVEMSTIGVRAIRQIEAGLRTHGIQTVDAPVSGGPLRSLAGDLTVMTAAPAAAMERVMPLLCRLSSRVLHIADHVGPAQAVKLVNNLLAAANFANTFEALVISAKMGLDVDKVAEVINLSSGQNTGLSARKTQAIFEGRFDNGGQACLLDKDVRLALQAAADAGFPVEALHALRGTADYWRAVVAQGMGEADVTAAIQLLEQRAGASARSRSG